MNRRGFFSALAGAAAAAYDPERALWLPGRKLISIPRPNILSTVGWASSQTLAPGDIITIDGWYELNPATREELRGVLQHFQVEGPPGSTVLVPRTASRAAEILRRLRYERRQ